MVTTGQERHSTIAIGDIHGLDKWKAVVDAHPDSRIVFLGDYFDPYDDISHADMLANFSEIMELKRSRPEDVVLLLGNHDLHYFNSYAAVGSRYDLELAEVFADIFLDNLYLFQNAYQEGNVVFTHAGISQAWFERDFKGDASKPIADQLNNPADSQMCALHRVGWRRGGRVGALGGIFWADISELDEPLHGCVQVVGHNRVGGIVEHAGRHDNKIIFCDCLRTGGYYIVK